MRNNVYSLEHYRMNKNNGTKIVSMFNWISWVLLAIGSIMFLVNVNDFTSSNLGLMIGIGVIIAGLQVYGIGVFIHLLQSKPVDNRV